MLYRQLGKTALNVSVLGVGCWALGNDWTDANDQESIAIIKEAVDQGVNFFDVAPVYGYGHAEEVLGKALKGIRHQVHIATKCGLKWNAAKEVTRDLSPESVQTEIEQSLRRLQTDYVDVYQMHWPDPNTPIERTMEVMARLKESGKIRHIGVSNFSVPLMEQARTCGEVVSNQVLFNMLERNPLQYHGLPLEYRTEQEVIPYCTQNQISVIPYSPLFQGLLTGKFHRDEISASDVRVNNPELNGKRLERNLQKVEALAKIAEKYGRPLNQLALNWLLSHKAVTTIIAGATKKHQLQENINALGWTIADPDLRAIDQIVKEEI